MQELKINAVEMVRSIRDAHYEQVKDLPAKDKITFFRGKARALYAELGIPEEMPSAPASKAQARR
ncbi:MAG TPA: hypothetical protein VIA62_25860 [Thermoanaerobaculia bacterium]|jgi:hypothetical protein|nr:hypothetical protein [Thermoanaerobaculia bacterium]